MPFDLDLTALDAAHIAPGATRRLTLHELGIALDLRTATEDNAAYWSAYVAGQAERARRAQVLGAQDPAANLAEHRRSEAALFAAHVVVGWEGVKRSDGSPATLSPEAARELLLAIIDKAPRIWDRIERFANDAERYTTRAIAAAEALAGNSFGG